jgi:hypothetical protein
LNPGRRTKTGYGFISRCFVWVRIRVSIHKRRHMNLQREYRLCCNHLQWPQTQYGQDTLKKSHKNCQVYLSLTKIWWSGN